MLYDLMHKDIPVLQCNVSMSGQLHGISDVYNEDHIPYGAVDGLTKRVSNRSLDQWIHMRLVPHDRFKAGDIKNFMLANGMTVPGAGYGSMMLSLSDHYWFKPEGMDFKYADVNLFENNFDQSIGELMLGQNFELLNKRQSFGFTPDICSNGYLQKSWRILDGQRILLKAGVCDEPVNELIASDICNMLGFKHVPYKAYKDSDGNVYSACKTAVNLNTEFVTANDILLKTDTSFNPARSAFTYKQYLKDHYINMVCLDQMNCIDGLVMNSDRHWSNFGVLRDPDTLKVKDVMPLFDHGNSLWYNYRAFTSNIGCEETSKYSGKLLYQDCLDSGYRFTKDQIDGFSDIMLKRYKEFNVDDKRANTIINAFRQRCDKYFLDRSKERMK